MWRAFVTVVSLGALLTAECQALAGGGGATSTTDIAYGYDGLNRLVSESSVSSVSSVAALQFGKTYVYDLVGNRLSRVTTGDKAETATYSYNGNDQLMTENAVAQAGTNITSYGYDANGSLVSKQKVGPDPETTAYMSPPEFAS